MHGSKLNTQAKQAFIDAYTEKVLGDFFEQNERMNGQQIISLTSVKQVNFFILKILFEEWQAETRKLRNPYFDYESEEVSQALKTLVNTLSKNISIQKEDFKSLFKKALEETIQLLYNTSQFFLNEAKKCAQNGSIKQFKSSAKYIKLYKSTFDTLMMNLESTALDNFSEIEQIIEKSLIEQPTDKEEREEIERVLNAIIPFDVLEKETQDLPVALPEKEEQSVNFFDSLEEETTEIIPQEVNQSEKQSSEENLNDEFSPTETATEESLDEMTTDISEPDKGLVENELSLNDKLGDNIQTLNQKYEKLEEVETIASQHETKSISEISTSINLNQKYMFVNDLFEGNEKDYEIALSEIEGCHSFDSSVELLVQSYAKKYAWDMSSDEVKELLKVIFKRFR